MKQMLAYMGALGGLAGMFLLASCSVPERDNPNDPDGINYQPPSSSSAVPSSSSVASILPSSSSAPPAVSNCSLNGTTVTIGSQVWMSENLNCDVSGSKCYNNDPSNCTKYGRLYNWATAMTACPAGWHLPSKEEWDALSSYVQSNKGCTSCDAKHLKSTSGWSNGDKGLDSYGFAALPGGDGSSDGSFLFVGDYGFWWTASEYGASYVYYRSMGYLIESVGSYNSDKYYLRSVRCLQD